MESLKGMFLVSMPALKGDYFQHSVTFLVDHNRDGAFGLIINLPTSSKLGEIFPEIDGDANVGVLEGGPVEQDRIFFLHSPDKHYDSSVIVNPDATLTTSAHLISDLAINNAPDKLLALVGYAGWGAGQLENEILADAWLVTPFDSSILFGTDFKHKPQAAAKLMGLDLNLIGANSGHG
jgi:putative transcriptional regulator